MPLPAIFGKLPTMVVTWYLKEPHSGSLGVQPRSPPPLRFTGQSVYDMLNNADEIPLMENRHLAEADMKLLNFSRQQTSRWVLVLTLLLLAELLLGLGAAITSPPSREARPVRFVVIGDSGTGDKHQKKVARQMVAYHDQYQYQFVIMVGDNIYPDGDPQDYQDKFNIPYATLLQEGVKFYAALGNHDNPHWRDAVKYPRFNMNGQRYYTFTEGNGLAQFFALDSNTLQGGRQDEAQLRWLQNELHASPALWKIVYFHHPIYSSGKTHGSDVKMRAVLEPLLIDGGVRVVFSGHDHFYERIIPQHGIYYFVTGAAGQLRRGNIDRRTGLTIKGDDQVRHFMYVEVERDEMRFQAVSEDGEVIDSGGIPALIRSISSQHSAVSIQ